jgi:hypothetical protein
MSGVEEREDDVLRTCIEQLQRPIDDAQVLLRALCPPLEALGVLPSALERYVDVRIRPVAQVTPRHVSKIQLAVLQYVLPIWELELQKQRLSSVLNIWLSPERSSDVKLTGTIAVEAYSSLLAVPITEQTLPYLAQLVKSYPVEIIHAIIFQDVSSDDPKVQLRWEDAVRVLTSIPGKVANAALTLKLDVPPSLEYGPYFNRLCVGSERLISEHCGHRSRGKFLSLEFLGPIPTILQPHLSRCLPFSPKSPVSVSSHHPRPTSLLKYPTSDAHSLPFVHDWLPTSPPTTPPSGRFYSLPSVPLSLCKGSSLHCSAISIQSQDC